MAVSMNVSVSEANYMIIQNLMSEKGLNKSEAVNIILDRAKSNIRNTKDKEIVLLKEVINWYKSNAILTTNQEILEELQYLEAQLKALYQSEISPLL